jgi:hypothetical protein
VNILLGTAKDVNPRLRSELDFEKRNIDASSGPDKFVEGLE